MTETRRTDVVINLTVSQIIAEHSFAVIVGEASRARYTYNVIYINSINFYLEIEISIIASIINLPHVMGPWL